MKNRSNQSTADLSDALVRVMRRIPSVVTIVTAADGERSRGVTIGSFTSLSLEPPLISFNLAGYSQMHTLMDHAEEFVVHIPGYEQRGLCQRFALSDLDDQEQFEGVETILSDRGVPVIPGVISEIHCRVHHRFTAGDHTIVVGRVRQVNQHRCDPPVLYLDGTYHPIDGE